MKSYGSCFAGHNKIDCPICPNRDMDMRRYENVFSIFVCGMVFLDQAD